MSFIGCLIYIVKLPELRLYWKEDDFFGNSKLSHIISGNIFEFVKRNLHLNDTSTVNPSDVSRS